MAHHERRTKPFSLTFLLAGATLRDRLVAGLGAAIGISATAILSRLLIGPEPGLPLLIASFGASAVLVYAVPASPLAQPWPVIGGNALSALFGVAVGRMVPDPAIAGGVAVGGSILLMSLLRCLHPPGGGTALFAALGGASGHYPFTVAILPIGLDAVIFVGIGLLFHRFSGHSYPHRPAVAPPVALLHREDVDRALAELGETFDIDPDDLEALLARAETHAQARVRR
jgi:CBS domain-containing membrane protein